MVAEYDAANVLRASYLTTLGSGDLPGMPLETSIGVAKTYPLLDGVGSVTGATDASGALGSSFSYTAYGTPVGASSGTYAYGTYGYDTATGLYYARARYYDPGSGRFLGEDPQRAVNLYAYADGSPSVAGDPSGLSPIAEAETIDSEETLATTSWLGTKNPAWQAMIGATGACLGDAIWQLQTTGTIDPIELFVYTVSGALAGPTLGLLGVWKGVVFGIMWTASTNASSDLITGKRTNPADYVIGSGLGAVPVSGPMLLAGPSFAALLQWVVDRLRGALPSK